MRRQIKVFIFIMVGFVFNLKAQSLENYLKIAADNNPLLKAKYAEFEAALQKTAQVNSLPDPQLSFGFFISPVETRVGPQQLKIGLAQMFPWFGTLSTGGDIYKFQAEAKYQEFINSRNELFMQVKSVWYAIHEVHQKIELQKENMVILNSYKKLTTTGFKNNKNSLVDVLRVDILNEKAESDIMLLEEQLRPLSVQLNQLINQPVETAVQFNDSLTIVEIAVDYRKDSLLNNHPMLVSLDLKYQATQQAELLAKKQGLPKFGIGLDYVFVGERTDMVVPDNGKNIVMPMVSMSIPIFSNKYSASKKEAQFKQVALSQYKIDFENSLVTAYEMTRYEVLKSKELFRLYEVQIEKTKRAISLLEKAYASSELDFEEVLRMQQQLIDYQINQVTAVQSFYTGLAKLDFLTAK